MDARRKIIGQVEPFPAAMRVLCGRLPPIDRIGEEAFSIQRETEEFVADHRDGDILIRIHEIGKKPGLLRIELGFWHGAAIEANAISKFEGEALGYRRPSVAQ